jgi:pyruvate formate lyase activating enzyme
MTPEKTLLRARDIGKGAGLKYVYLGNVRGSGYSDTFCPSCHELLVERDGFSVGRNKLKDSDHCPGCGEKIAGVWK